jgi:uncharacterized protein (DUF1015 family)
VTRLWRVADPALIRGVSAAMDRKGFFIADGHHRYETALTYRNLMRESKPGSTGREPWNFVMMYFSNMRAPGLTVFPTHRAVFGLEDFRVERFLSRVREHFTVEDVEGGRRELLERLIAHRAGRHAFGLAVKGEDRLRILVLREEAVMDRLLAGRVPKVLRTLDVTVLHTLLLDRILGIDEGAQERQENLRYVKGSLELLRVVREGECQLGFVLNPTKVEEVKRVAEEGERMPQKSTFFHPKLVTGLVINPLFEGDPVCQV